MNNIREADIKKALVGYEIINVRKKRGGEFCDEQMTLTLRHSKTKEELKAKIFYYSNDHEIWVETYQRPRNSKSKKKREHQWKRIGDAGTCIHESSIFKCEHCGCMATVTVGHAINPKDYPPCVSRSFMKAWRKKH